MADAVLMAELYQTIRQGISMYLAMLYSEGELEQNRVVKEYFTTVAEVTVARADDLRANMRQLSGNSG
ncbi:MAG: hypothetical protein HN350_16290 [Phycisphaerales bacterium]|jgi:hypothetical protein|nr:hypothetical protein [Phycisphaerales bacterium]